MVTNQNLTLQEVLETVSRLLTTASIEHSLIGGIAIGLRGYPRSTVDVDYLVNGNQAIQARELLQQNGFVCEVETGETMHFSGPGSVDFLIAKRPLSLQMIDNATKLADISSSVALVEDLIGLKIQAYCNDPQRIWKDQADIAELIKANPAMNWEKVMDYARIFGEEQTLENIRQRLQQ